MKPYTFSSTEKDNTFTEQSAASRKYPPSRHSQLQRYPHLVSRGHADAPHPILSLLIDSSIDKHAEATATESARLGTRWRPGDQGRKQQSWPDTKPIKTDEPSPDKLTENGARKSLGMVKSLP
jgi:hypothetical protein